MGRGGLQECGGVPASHRIGCGWKIACLSGWHERSHGEHRRHAAAHQQRGAASEPEQHRRDRSRAPVAIDNTSQAVNGTPIPAGAANVIGSGTISTAATLAVAKRAGGNGTSHTFNLFTMTVEENVARTGLQVGRSGHRRRLRAPFRILASR